MEYLLLLLLAIGFIWFRNSFTQDLKNLTNEIRFLRNAISNLEKDKSKEQAAEKKPVTPVEEKKIIPPYIKEEIVPKPKPIPEAPPKPVTPKEPAWASTHRTEPIEKAKAETFDSVKKPVIPEKTFWERNPDLEKFIGENLINKIGIGILVLGIAYFVKFAIDKEWINEIGRVGIGILCGGILIFIAHKLHKTYKAFSSVLVGGGLAALYFTIAIGFHEYQIFSQTIAFVIMALITGFAVALSIAYDRMELAVLALIGGFASPFIVSTGEGNYIVLFTYLLILNSGMLVLAFRKKWNLVNILCYAFTVLIYGSWLTMKCLGKMDAPYVGALIYGASFYLLFFVSNIIYNIRNKIAFKVFEIGILISNTFLFYAAGMSILHFYHNGNLQGLFTAVVGVYNFAWAYAFYKNNNIDRNLIYLLIGLVLTFLSLAAPVQLEGNYITLFWSAEAVLLLWFSQKSGLTIVKFTTMLVNGLMCYSLVMDWVDLYLLGPSYSLPVILNKAFITSAVSFISVVLSLRLLRDQPDYVVENGQPKLSLFKTALKVASVLILYFTITFELVYQLHHYGQGSSAITMCVGIFNALFLSAFYFRFREITSGFYPTFILCGSLALMFVYVAIFNVSIISIRNDFLQTGNSSIYFYLHFLFTILAAFIIFILNKTANKLFKKNESDMFRWVVVGLIVFLCSAELNHIVTWLSYEPGRIIDSINKQVLKAGYTVLWGIISLILMQQGMQRKDRMLRIISLTLFAISIVKLFAWDIKGVSEGGRIAAFISLGALLLVVSFMYQRLKNLILKDEESNSEIKTE